MSESKIRISTIVLYLTIMVAVILNMICSILNERLTMSKWAMIYITIISIISHLLILILLKNELYLKVGFYYCLYIVVTQLINVVSIQYSNITIVWFVYRLFRGILRPAFFFMSSYSLYYFPGHISVLGFGLPNRTIFSEVVLVMLLLLYGIKLKKVATN